MRYPWIDVAKGIGIILVVFGHVLRGLIKSGIASGDVYNYIDSIIYTFHMPLFMLLSGVFVVSSISKYGNKKFLVTKLDVIFYPYVIWMILQGSLEVLLSKYTNGNASLVEVFSIWLPRAQFWYLHSLFIFLLVFTAFYYFFRKWVFILLPVSFLLYLYFGSDEMGFFSSLNHRYSLCCSQGRPA
jgi:fucose 4-O-acetylase-like acetyltransferase